MLKIESTYNKYAKKTLHSLRYKEEFLKVSTDICEVINEYCKIRDQVFTVRGKRYPASDIENGKDVEVNVSVNKGTEQSILKVINGVTGFESWYLDEHLLKKIEFNEFGYLTACAGTSMRWDRLVLSTDDLYRELNERGYY